MILIDRFPSLRPNFPPLTDFKENERERELNVLGRGIFV
jgi:hypothetical protein